MDISEVTTPLHIHFSFVPFQMSVPTIQVVILADSAIGKTWVIGVLCHHRFSEFNSPTSATDVVSLLTTAPSGESLKLCLWDTAQEAQRFVAMHSVRGVKILILSFDLDQPNSLIGVKGWHETAIRVVPKATFVCERITRLFSCLFCRIVGPRQRAIDNWRHRS
jgi:GTPase SAR1 family protein